MVGKLFVVAALAALTPSLTLAQRPTRPSRADTAARMCDMRYKMLMLTVVDRRGAPVPGVTVTLAGIAASSEGRPAQTTSETGEVQVAEDGDMRFVSAAGTKVTATLRKGGKVRRVPLTIGHDAAGCHIELLKGGPRVVF